ncbi:MAG TPA: hypothetical protein PKY31_16380 [Spirochaetota bacterium]|nr:hypothetical protein [Spirochaetota bacterium]
MKKSEIPENFIHIHVMTGYILYVYKKRYTMKALSLLAALILALNTISCDRQELFDAAKMAAEEPEGITELRVTGVTMTSISFEWDPVDGATAYRLYRSPDSEFADPYLLTDSLITAYTDSESMIVGGATFYYRVGVVLETGEEYSNTVNARTGTLPAAPAWLNAAAGVGEVTLTWSEVPGANYNIHRNYETTPFVTGITVTNYVDVIVGDWTYNSYQVKAVNEFGMSDFSPSADAYAQLGPVGNLTVVESSSTSVTLSWEPVRNANYYMVKATGLADVPNGLSTMYTYSTLAAGATYDFQVVAWSYGDMFTAATPSITLDSFTLVSRAEIASYNSLLTASASSQTPLQYDISMSPLPAGSVFIYLSQTGFYGKFEIQNDVSLGTTLQFRCVLFNADGTVANSDAGLVMNNYDFCDLDLGDVLPANNPSISDFQWSSVDVLRTITPVNSSGFYRLY